jgi:hypothetical protein
VSVFRAAGDVDVMGLGKRLVVFTGPSADFLVNSYRMAMKLRLDSMDNLYRLNLSLFNNNCMGMAVLCGLKLL